MEKQAVKTYDCRVTEDGDHKWLGFQNQKIVTIGEV